MQSQQDQNDKLLGVALCGLTEGVRMQLPFADANCRDPIGRTPLMRAAATINFECIDLLLPLSDAKAQDQFGRTALMFAAEKNRFECVKRLIPASDVNAVDNRGRAALFYAARTLGMESLNLLLEHADASIRDNLGRTPLMVSASFPNPSVQTLMRVNDVNAVDNEGWTAMTWAARCGCVDTVRELFGASAITPELCDLTLRACAANGSWAAADFIAEHASVAVVDEIVAFAGDKMPQTAVRLLRAQVLENLSTVESTQKLLDSGLAGKSLQRAFVLCAKNKLWDSGYLLARHSHDERAMIAISALRTGKPLTGFVETLFADIQRGLSH